MINKKLSILSIFFVSLLAVSAVSAADNATEDIVGVDETTGDIVSVETDNKILEKNNEGTFTDLANDIAKARNILNLNRNYTYTDSDSDYEYGIDIAKNIVINGNGYTINGNNQAVAFAVYSEGVVLNDINFMNCNYGTVYWYGDEGTLSDCSFVDCTSDYDGSAVYWSGDDGVLSGCSFMNCSDFGHHNKDSEAYEPSCGGAVYWKGNNGYLYDCDFKDCYGDDGGAVFWYAENGYLSDCSFIDCSAEYGGAVSWDANYGKVNESTFINCHAKYSNGAVSWTGNEGTLSACNFLNCYSTYGGGAFYCSGDFVYVFETNFINCSDSHDGGAVLWPGYNGIIDKSNFINCSSSNDGGAIWWSGYYGKVYKSSFINCHAENNGGGICFDADDCWLVNSIFEDCAAKEGSNWYSKKPIIFINQTKTFIEAPDVTISYGNYGHLVATLKDVNNKPLANEEIYLESDIMRSSATTNSKGEALFDVPNNLNPKTYIVTIYYPESDDYYPSSTTAKIIVVNKLETKLTANYDANSKNIIATVKDSNGNPINGLRVGFALNGVKYATTDANGRAKYSTAGFADGTYKVTVQAYGNEIYMDSNKETVTFTIKSKEMSKIFLRNALYFVTQTKLVQVTLWDANNNPLANKTVYIKAYDSVWHGVTNENGDAFVRVGIGFGVHDATVSFDGDDQYNASTRAGYIRVIKQTPSVMVRGTDTMFKASDNNKVVKVHLRDRYDKALPEGSKIVLKLNGKTYVGTTDINGVASIKISINTIGTFTAEAMYGGNSAFNAVTRDVKIRIT